MPSERSNLRASAPRSCSDLLRRRPFSSSSRRRSLWCLSVSSASSRSRRSMRCSRGHAHVRPAPQARARGPLPPRRARVSRLSASSGELALAFCQLCEVAFPALGALRQFALVVQLGAALTALARASASSREFAITRYLDELCELGNLSLTALGELCEIAFTLGQLCDVAFSALGQFGELALTLGRLRRRSRSCALGSSPFPLALGERRLGRGELRPLFLQLGEEERVGSLARVLLRAVVGVRPGVRLGLRGVDDAERRRAGHSTVAFVSPLDLGAKSRPEAGLDRQLDSVLRRERAREVGAGDEAQLDDRLAESPAGRLLPASARSSSSSVRRPCSTRRRPSGRQAMWAASTRSISAWIRPETSGSDQCLFRVTRGLMWNWRAVGLFQTKPGRFGVRRAGCLREDDGTAWRRVGRPHRPAQVSHQASNASPRAGRRPRRCRGRA